MDALDEFFAVWTEPEAWCEICGEFPAIHVVLRDTGGKFGGIMSHVRIWNPNTQTRVPACRHCCKDQMSAIGQSTSPPRAAGMALSIRAAPVFFHFCGLVGGTLGSAYGQAFEPGAAPFVSLALAVPELFRGKIEYR